MSHRSLGLWPPGGDGWTELFSRFPHSLTAVLQSIILQSCAMFSNFSKVVKKKYGDRNNLRILINILIKWQRECHNWNVGMTPVFGYWRFRSFIWVPKKFWCLFHLLKLKKYILHVAECGGDIRNLELLYVIKLELPYINCLGTLWSEKESARGSFYSFGGCSFVGVFLCLDYISKILREHAVIATMI